MTIQVLNTDVYIMVWNTVQPSYLFICPATLTLVINVLAPIIQPRAWLQEFRNAFQDTTRQLKTDTIIGRNIIYLFYSQFTTQSHIPRSLELPTQVEIYQVLLYLISRRAWIIHWHLPSNDVLTRYLEWFFERLAHSLSFCQEMNSTKRLRLVCTLCVDCVIE